MSEWVNIKERLPDPNTGILVTDGKIITAAELDFMDDEPWWWSSHGFGGYEWDFDFPEAFDRGAITHWMPLPELPVSAP